VREKGVEVGSNAGDRPPRLEGSKGPRRALLALAGAALLVLSGCSRDELVRLGLPEPATDRAGHTLSLWQGAWIAALAVGVVVWGLIIWAVIAYRKKSDRIPPQFREHLPIEALYFGIPLIMVAVLFFFTARDQSAILKTDKQNPPEHVLDIVGQQWSWTFNYRERGEQDSEVVWETGTPEQLPTLYLPVNEPVQVRLSTPDVIHSFFVPAFLFKMDVIPGKVNTYEFTATKEGEFAGKCAELCGYQHARMLFTVHVVSRVEYDAHLQELRSAGQTGLADGTDTSREQVGIEREAEAPEDEGR
jgi:cytochrome c oxidase subunit 2